MLHNILVKTYKDILDYEHETNEFKLLVYDKTNLYETRIADLINKLTIYKSCTFWSDFHQQIWEITFG